MWYGGRTTPRTRGTYTAASTFTPFLTALRRDRIAEAAREGVFSLYTPSTYSDKILSCVDCNQEFVFAATDQQFYAEKEFSEPRRCASCRAARKAARGESSGSGYGGGSSYGGGGGSSYGGGQREMFTATCDGCGGEARVPFRPTGSKPVYCSNCFSTRR